MKAWVFNEKMLAEALADYKPVCDPPDQPAYAEIVRKSVERAVLTFLNSPAADRHKLVVKVAS